MGCAAGLIRRKQTRPFPKWVRGLAPRNVRRFQLTEQELQLAARVTEDNYGLAPGKPEYCREPLFTKDASITAAGLPPPPPEAVTLGAMDGYLASASGSLQSDWFSAAN